MKNAQRILRWLPPRRIHSIYVTLSISELSTGLATPIFTFLFFSTTTTLLPVTMSNPKRAMYFALFLSLYKFSSIASNPIFGSLSDMLGRKKIFSITIAGGLVLSVFTVIALLVHSLWLFIFGACVFAFVWAQKTVAAAAINDVSLESQKIKNLSLMQFCIGIGVGIGPIISGYIGGVGFFGYDYIFPFVILGLFSLFLLFYVKISIPETLQPRYRSSLDEYFRLANLKVIFSNKKVYFLMIIHIFNQLSWGTYYDFLPAVAKTVFHYNLKGVGILVGLVGFCLIIGTGLVLPVIRKYLSNTGLINFSCILGAFGVSIAFLSSFFPTTSWGHVGLWISTLPVAVGDVILFCVLVSNFSASVNEKYQGVMVGLVYIIGTGMWAIGAPIGGWLMHWRMNGALLLCPLSMLILLCFLKSFQKKQWFLSLNNKR